MSVPVWQLFVAGGKMTTKESWDRENHHNFFVEKTVWCKCILSPSHPIFLTEMRFDIEKVVFQGKGPTATKWRKTLTLIFRGRRQLVVDPCSCLSGPRTQARCLPSCWSPWSSSCRSTRWPCRPPPTWSWRGKGCQGRQSWSSQWQKPQRCGCSNSVQTNGKKFHVSFCASLLSKGQYVPGSPWVGSGCSQGSSAHQGWTSPAKIQINSALFRRSALLWK